MSEEGVPVRVELRPLGHRIDVEHGASLRDVLGPYGVEFPCGGRGRCRRCRVKVLEGSLSGTDEQEGLLTSAELAEGWRVACLARVDGDVAIEIGEWAAPVLCDESSFDFHPQPGLGVAVDLGTTTIVAQLLDRTTGRVLAVETALNPQAVHGSDVMSRVELAVQGCGTLLTDTIRDCVGKLVSGLGGTTSPSDVVVVGNTVMHHLFCGLDLRPLSRHPFESPDAGLQIMQAAELGWEMPATATVRFLPCIGGFVGSDALAGVLAAGIHESDAIVALIDLGTNGEIVVGNRERILCASTAAGPAFEGGGVSVGMRATTGAISEVRVDSGRLVCRVLGDVPPHGICGSGLVDAVAAALDLGFVEPSGRLAKGRNPLTLAGPVALSQADIRQLQLAKGAVAAALRILMHRLGAGPGDLEVIHLAGSFGNYVTHASARRIGLIDPAVRGVVEAAGNTALRGAKLALFRGNGADDDLRKTRDRVEHISLAADPEFQTVFVDELGFPP